MKILVASRNPKKLAELSRVLESSGVSGVELVSLTDVPEYEEVPETGASFEDNALIKAREGVKHTGLACVADDSGLAVDALNWMPGCCRLVGVDDTAMTPPTPRYCSHSCPISPTSVVARPSCPRARW